MKYMALSLYNVVWNNTQFFWVDINLFIIHVPINLPCFFNVFTILWLIDLLKIDSTWDGIYIMPVSVANWVHMGWDGIYAMSVSM